MTGRFSQPLHNRRGQRLECLQYSASRPQAILVWLHGYGEHCQRYRPVHTFWADAGIIVSTFDAHGHGLSQPDKANERCLVLDFRHLVDDAQQFAEQVRAAMPAGLPLFLGGQSLGALIATHLAMRDQSCWTGLVLTSAAMDVEWTWILRMQQPFAGLLSHLIPRAQIVPAVDPKDFSPDPAVVADFVADKLNFKGKVRARTAAETLRGFAEAGQQSHTLRLPVYAHHGTADKVTSLPAIRIFMSRIASKDKTLREIDGGYHELLMGRNFAQHAQPIAEWILQRCPASKL